jgi:glycosyltransferase involved in cell wall biosynthesis
LSNLEKKNSTGPNRRIIVVSGDTLPLPGLSTTGAGLRAWGLGEGLRSRGHEVLYLMPEVGLQRLHDIPDLPIYHTTAFNDQDPQQLDRLLLDLQPEVIVFQHWSAARFLSEDNQIPTVIDFHGPMMLELLYQDLPNYAALRRKKLSILPKADLFTCAGEFQRHYFYSWLIECGFDVRDDLIKVIPVSLSPEIPQRGPWFDEPTFVYGGMFLPWQDPTHALEILVSILEKRRSGQLRIYGGVHPHIQIPPGKYRELIPRLQASPYVKMAGVFARDELLKTYLRSHVAIDVMARNPERELAFTTRTVEYLWCGLPVIYNNYAELAQYIQRYDAGWIVDPEDTRAIQSAIEMILDDPASVTRKSANAQTLAREEFSWDRTIEPLDKFCRNPYKRSRDDSLTSAPQSDDSLMESRAQLIERLSPDVRRVRRGLAARTRAIVTAMGKTILKSQYRFNLHGRQVRVTEPLLPRVKMGQAFRAYADNLRGIGIAIGTQGRFNTCHVVFQLRAVADPDRVVARVQVNAMLIADTDFYHFYFEPIENSRDRDFYFWLESPDAVLGDCVILFRNIQDDALVFTPDYHEHQV